MGTKNNPGEFDCYANAEPDEPVFVLLGRDASASGLVKRWAGIREDLIRIGVKPIEDIDMVKEARKCAMEMDAYYQKRQLEKNK